MIALFYSDSTWQGGHLATAHKDRQVFENTQRMII